MLTSPSSVPDMTSMDTIGNVEPTMLRMMTVRVVPRASYVAGGASDDAKGVMRMEVPCSMTMRDLAAEVLRETSAPTTTMRVRAWLGMNAHRNAEEGVGASAPAVQMYAVDECELVPVPPLTRVEDLASLARGVHVLSDAEVTVYYASENKLGGGEELLCLACCAVCACCVACCAAGAISNAKSDANKPPPNPRPNTNNTYTPNNYGQGGGGNYSSGGQGGYNNPYPPNGNGQQGGGYAPNTYGLPPNQPGTQPYGGNQNPYVAQPQYGGQYGGGGQPVYGQQPTYGGATHGNTPNTGPNTNANYTQPAPL